MGKKIDEGENNYHNKTNRINSYVRGSEHPNMPPRA